MDPVELRDDLKIFISLVTLHLFSLATDWDRTGDLPVGLRGYSTY